MEVESSSEVYRNFSLRRGGISVCSVVGVLVARTGYYKLVSERSRF